LISYLKEINFSLSFKISDAIIAPINVLKENNPLTKVPNYPFKFSVIDLSKFKIPHIPNLNPHA